MVDKLFTSIALEIFKAGMFTTYVARRDLRMSRMLFMIPKPSYTPESVLRLHCHAQERNKITQKKILP